MKEKENEKRGEEGITGGREGEGRGESKCAVEGEADTKTPAPGRSVASFRVAPPPGRTLRLRPRGPNALASSAGSFGDSLPALKRREAGQALL